MKYFITILVALSIQGPVFHQGFHTTVGSSCGTWSHCEVVTIDHTKAGTADTSNYPFLFYTTSKNSLRTVAHGGEVQNSSGFDIAFFSDACVTGLDFERATYDGLVGLMEFYVRIPTLSHTSDTPIYLCWDNSSISTDQSNPHGVWDSNFVFVHHYSDGITLSTTDSTSNANDGTSHSALPDTGQVGGAIFTTGGRYEEVTRSSSINNAFDSSNYSVELWAKSSDTTLDRLYQLQDTSSGFHIVLFNYPSAGNVRFYSGSGSDSDAIVSSSSSLNDNNFHSFGFVLNSGTQRMYVDGAADTTGTAATGTSSDTDFFLGTNPGLGQMFTGDIDELRVSNVARSASYFTATYNNQHSPSTFYTEGSELLPVPLSLSSLFQNLWKSINAR